MAIQENFFFIYREGVILNSKPELAKSWACSGKVVKCCGWIGVRVFHSVQVFVKTF